LPDQWKESIIVPDDGPCETETCRSEARLNINKNLEAFVVVTVVLSLLLIAIHNRMHTVKLLLYRFTRRAIKL
jgi:hypothetical protein